MAERLKLTRPQREMLEELGEKVGRMHCDPSYKPIARLHELGLVDRKDHSMSAPSYALTEAGRAALNEARDAE